MTDGPAEDALIGTVLADKYRLEKKIGSGAMGAIYLAEHIALQRRICVKVMHPHVAADVQLVKRFRREAKLASTLEHESIIRVTDFGQAPVRRANAAPYDVLYLVMDYIEGRDLADVLYKEGPFPARRAIAVARQVASALDEAHAIGVVHRDLKPENIMVFTARNGEERVKVLDFGIAKILDDGRSDATRLTLAGTVCGTPEYMSPEQARGQDLDGRSDLYALGVILYQLVTGQLPFDGGSPIEIVTKHLTQHARPPSAIRQGIPPALETVVLRLLEKDRDRRLPNAVAVGQELERIESLLSSRTAESSPELLRTSPDLAPPSMLAGGNLPAAGARPSEAARPASAPAPRTTPSARPASSAGRRETEPRGPSVLSRYGAQIGALVLLLALGVGLVLYVLHVRERNRLASVVPAPSARARIEAATVGGPATAEPAAGVAPASAGDRASEPPPRAVPEAGVVLSPAAPADGANPEQVAASLRAERAGDLFQENGEFEKAIGELERAYKAHERPELLKKIGRCYVLLRDRDRAAPFLERYLEQIPEERRAEEKPQIDAWLGR